jgi:hypothetical protein
MLTNTQTIVETVLASDPSVDPDMGKRALDLLQGKAKDSPRPVPITTKEACSILSVSSVTLRRYAKRGLLHPIRHTARRHRWDRNQVEQFRDFGAHSEHSTS